jgi:predicted SnoaL-like aldol condensation-catalyzing enzyme
MTNKDAAVSFLRLVTAGKIREGYEKHVAPDFKHHNPYFGGHAESLMAGMEESEARFPGKKLKIHQVIVEGDVVAVHSHVVLKPLELEFSTVHILRFREQKIVELWDVAQQIPMDSPNENGAF